MSIIETIRAELLRHKELFKEAADVGGYYASARRDEVNELLSFLDTLQEQPVCEGLEEEIDKRWKEWLSEDKEQAEGILPKSEFSFYARHFYELGKQSKKRELLPMIERICVSCPEKVKAESALNKFISKNCVHCSIEHCPGVKACYTSSNEQLQ